MREFSVVVQCIVGHEGLGRYGIAKFKLIIFLRHVLCFLGAAIKRSLNFLRCVGCFVTVIDKILPIFNLN